MIGPSEPVGHRVALDGKGGTGRGVGIPLRVVVEHAARRRTAAGTPAVVLIVGGPETDELRAAEFHLLRPAEVVEDAPALRFAGQPHGDVGEVQLPDIVDGRDVRRAADLLTHLAAAVHRLIRLVHYDERRAAAGKQIVLAEVVQRVLGIAKGKQLRANFNSLGAEAVALWLPVHAIAAEEEIAAGDADGEQRRDGPDQHLVRETHRRGRERVAALLHLTGETEEAAQNENIAAEHCKAEQQTAVLDIGQREDRRIPDEQRGCGGGAPSCPRLFLHCAQCLPEAEEEQHLHREHGIGQRRPHGGGVYGVGIDRRVENDAGQEQRRAQHGEQPAGAKPTVLPPQRTEAKQLQDHADGRQQIVQAEKVERDGAHGAAAENISDRAAPRRDVPCDVVGRKLGRGGLQQSVKFAVVHASSPPSALRNAFLMR